MILLIISTTKCFFQDFQFFKDFYFLRKKCKQNLRFQGNETFMISWVGKQCFESENRNFVEKLKNNSNFIEMDGNQEENAEGEKSKGHFCYDNSTFIQLFLNFSLLNF